MSDSEPEAIIKFRVAQKESDSAHQGYRKTGFGISAGIITLSSGLLYFGLNKNPPIQDADVFALPIILSFLQQLANYLAAHSEARSLSKATTLAVIAAYPDQKIDVVPYALDRYFLFNRQNLLYTVSDWLCVIASVTFVGLCDIAVFYAGPLWISWVTAIATIGGILSISRPYIVMLSWKKKLKTKGSEPAPTENK